MSGLTPLSDQRVTAIDSNSKKVGMESDFQNMKDVLEDAQDANRNKDNDGNLRDSMSSEEWEDAFDNFEGKMETEAAALEGSGQMSQAQTTEGAVGGAQQQSQAQTTEGAVGGAQQQSQAQTTEGAVGGAQQQSQAQTTESAVGGAQQQSQAQTTEGAVGGAQQQTQAQMTEGAVGGTQQSEATGGAVGGSLQNSHLQRADGVVGAFCESRTSMSEGAVGGRQQNSHAAALVSRLVFPRVLQRPTDPSEDHLQMKFIKQVEDYEGAPVAPSEYFELQWTVYQEELQGYLSQGLLPQDTVASAGIDEGSYKQMQQCAQELQDQLFEGNLLQCLGNLRGFRRIFSRSRDPYLCHAFRGNPLEVLQNIYYGGEGILPEDRMLLDDPFHYTRNPDGLDD